MNKQQFLDAFKKELCGLSQDDIQESLDFYSEMIDDHIEEGLSEEEAVASIGHPKEIAKENLINIPIIKLIKQKIKLKRSMRALEIVLLILGLPLWLSLLIAIIAVVFSIYVSLWSVIISLYAVDFSLAACGVAGCLAFSVFAFTGNMTQGVFLFGASLVCAGLSILMFMVSNLAAKGLLWLGRKMWISIKSCFIRKGEDNENC